MDSTKTLKLLVILMGLAILAGFVLVAVALVGRITGGQKGWGDLQFEAPAGCRIADMTAADGRLLLRLDGPAERGCQAVVVHDLGSGRALGRLRLKEAP